jgi:hypothetical protein
VIWADENYRIVGASPYLPVAGAGHVAREKVAGVGRNQTDNFARQIKGWGTLDVLTYLAT